MKPVRSTRGIYILDSIEEILNSGIKKPLSPVAIVQGNRALTTRVRKEGVQNTVIGGAGPLADILTEDPNKAFREKLTVFCVLVRWHDCENSILVVFTLCRISYLRLGILCANNFQFGRCINMKTTTDIQYTAREKNEVKNISIVTGTGFIE